MLGSHDKEPTTTLPPPPSKKIPCVSGKGRSDPYLKYAQCILPNQGLLYKGKDDARTLSHLEEGQTNPTPASSSLAVSVRAEGEIRKLLQARAQGHRPTED